VPQRVASLYATAHDDDDCVTTSCAKSKPRVSFVLVQVAEKKEVDTSIQSAAFDLFES